MQRNEDFATEDFHFGALEGSVFVMDNKEVENSSLHFDADIGPYISYKDQNFDDGSVVPPSILFMKYAFNEDKRRFIGMVDYGGRSIDKSTEVTYEMIFDTKYVCVVTGLMNNKIPNESGRVEVLGDNICYTNTHLESVDNDTEKRLQKEGASKVSIRPVLKQFRKYRSMSCDDCLVMSLFG